MSDGGAVLDVKLDDEGLYPFVSHAFAHVDLGQVGCSRSQPEGDHEPLSELGRDRTTMTDATGEA